MEAVSKMEKLYLAVPPSLSVASEERS